MSVIPGVYLNELNENVEQYLRETDYPEDMIKTAAIPGFTIKVTQEGNKYFLNLSSGINFCIDLDQELEEPFSKGSKSKALRLDNVITVVTKLGNGKITTRNHEFTKEGLRIVMIIGDVTCTRYYKRVNYNIGTYSN